MEVIEWKCLDAYLHLIRKEIPALIVAFDFSEDKGRFEYLIKLSDVYLFDIEGNSVDLSSYMNVE